MSQQESMPVRAADRLAARGSDAASDHDSSGSIGSISTVASVLMALSGFAGLGYQVVWTQQFGVWLGHEIVAVLAVVAAFFGGLAIGAWALGQRIESSSRPARWYAACEALIGLWGLLLIVAMPLANPWLAALTGPSPAVGWQWAIAFAGPFFLLLPATAAMGATLPAITGVRNRLHADGYAIGALYAANTGGAVAGVLATAFFLIPQFGLAQTALVCVLCNLACAAGALILLPAMRTATMVGGNLRRVLPAGQRDRRIGGLLFATGLLGIGHEVVVVRVLSQITEDTVYSFAVMLAVYLLGTAAGAAFYQRRLVPGAGATRETDSTDLLRQRLLCWLCLAMLASLPVLWQAEWLQGWLHRIFLAAPGNAGSGVGAAIGVEAALAAGAFALPSIIMGALFSHLCVGAKDRGWQFGAALGINTLGATCAPLLFGVLLLPLLGPKLLLVAIALAYLTLLPLRQWLQPAVLAPALAGLVFALSPASLDVVDVPEDGRLLSYRNGVMAAVSVVQDAEGVARLRINNRQQEGSSASGLADARLAYLPLLLHAAPRNALFLGLGTGVTAAAAAEDPALQVDAVELLPEVIDAAAWFRQPADDIGRAGMPHVMAADARRYVRATGKRYDVVVADLFHPARSGAGALYTVEHFAAVRNRLAPDGLFCQWLPLHQLDLDTLKSIVVSFMQVYPDAIAILATNSLETPILGLVARPDRPQVDIDRLRTRLAAPDGEARRATLQLGDAFSVLGSVIAGPSALARFAAGAPLNTDNQPTVAHRAPYLAYAPATLPRERLLTLLQSLEPVPAELLGVPVGEQAARWQDRLGDYWSARTRFIEAGMRVQPDPDPRRMLAQVGAPLLRIVRMSGDFRPAYDPLLRMAAAIAPLDPAQAAALLDALQSAQPARPEAALMRAQLRVASGSAARP